MMIFLHIILKYMIRYIFIFFFLIFLTGCEHDPIVPSHDICFETEILPILSSKCSMCHKPNSGSEGDRYDLTNYGSIISKNVDPGNPENSKLYTILKKGEEAHKNKATPVERALIYEWIKQGAKNDITCSPFYCDSNNVTYDNQVKKFFQRRCTNCHNGNQRPDLSIKDSAIAYARLPDSINYIMLKLQVNHSIIDTTQYYTNCEKTIIQKWLISGAH
jgi:hypothetical protein